MLYYYLGKIDMNNPNFRLSSQNDPNFELFQNNPNFCGELLKISQTIFFLAYTNPF